MQYWQTSLLEDLECQLVTAFYPRFSLFWLEQYNNSQVSSVMDKIETVVETTLMKSNEVCDSTTSNEDEENDFFSYIIQFWESRGYRSQNLVKT